MSSLVDPSQFAILFASEAFFESIGKIISSPFMAFLLRIGRDHDGRVTGLPFFMAGLPNKCLTQTYDVSNFCKDLFSPLSNCINFH